MINPDFMQTVSLLFFCLIFSLYVYMFFKARFILAEKELWELKSSYDELREKIKAAGEQNSALEEEAGQTLELFDVTKDICSFLDKELFFERFKEHVVRYLNISGIVFLESAQQPSCSADASVASLVIDKKTAGYLVAEGVRAQDKEKFFILSAQFMLGLKRVMLYKKVQDLAVTDSLTGIPARRHFLERARDELGRCERFGYAFSFLMIDVDGFKNFNDKYGHLVGDIVLKEISRMIQDNLRQIDLVGRYGGDEFLVILSEVGPEQALMASERIRKTIEGCTIRAYDEKLKATVSIGISSVSTKKEKMPELIEAADNALYKAKSSGKNKSCCA